MARETPPSLVFEGMGFVVVAVIPDARRIGKHDIMTAKRVPPPIKGE